MYIICIAVYIIYIQLYIFIYKSQLIYLGQLGSKWLLYIATN